MTERRHRPFLIAAVSSAVTAVLLIAAGAVAYRLWVATPEWQRDAESIPDIVSARNRPAMVHPNHLQGRLAYPDSPPMGGDHNPVWQRCTGIVYAQPPADEHAVHSLEHGAIWITYRPDLPAAEVEQLARRVRGQDYMLMSPYPGLRRPVSLQAWGYQLMVDSPADARIDRFVSALRSHAAREQYAPCDEGTLAEGAAAVRELG
jgi:hypothetical protein